MSQRRTGCKKALQSERKADTYEKQIVEVWKLNRQDKEPVMNKKLEEKIK